jgi:small subunit ribosomal protein S8
MEGGNKMNLTDPIADMLTRIRNANSSKHESVLVPKSNVKMAIAKILLEEGYIKDVKEDDRNIVITLKYVGNKQRVISGLKRISKPGLRVYAECENLPKVLNGLGIVLVSTSQGVMTDKKAREAGIGGEVMAYVW